MECGSENIPAQDQPGVIVVSTMSPNACNMVDMREEGDTIR